MAATINITHQFTSLNAYLVVRIVKHSNPTAEVARFSYAPAGSSPYHPERTTSFTNLDPVIYEVQFYNSIDGTALTALISTHNVQPKTDSVIDYLNIEFEVDRGEDNDPVAGTDTYTNSALTGYTFEAKNIVQRGIGPKKATEVTINTDGFQLLLGDAFSSGDTWFIFAYKNANYTLPLVSANQFTDIITLSAPTTLSSTNWGKLHVTNYAGDIGEVTFPAFSGIPDGTVIAFTTHTGSQRYLKISFAGGNSITYMGAAHSKFYLAKGELIILQFKSNVAYVLNYTGNYSRRGNVYGDLALRSNTVYADGTEYTKAQAEGLYDWVLNGPSDMKTDYTTWASSSVIKTKTVYPYKGKFAIDTGLEKIKVPDMRNAFERYLMMGTDAERTVNGPGGFQMYEVEAHTHANSNVWNESGTGHLASGGGSNEGGITDTTGSYGGAESRPSNYGKVPLVIL